MTHRLVADDGPNLADMLDDDVAVVVLTDVNYCTESMHDMDAVTLAVYHGGAIMVWDLCHSVGAMPVDLGGVGADFAWLQVQVPQRRPGLAVVHLRGEQAPACRAPADDRLARPRAPLRLRRRVRPR